MNIMVDYLDFASTPAEAAADLWNERLQSEQQRVSLPQEVPRKSKVDHTFFEVRSSVCVAGHYGDAVRDIKHRVASLMTRPCIESFHVSKASDLKEGALHVPKVVLVAVHSPGRKVIDDVEDRGQLDGLYDEVCETGADLMVIYMGLPKSIYPQVRHMVYHPKIEEMLFPTQPILRNLASENCFITIGENAELTNMQKNVIREWLERPVNSDHPVFIQANKRIAMEQSWNDSIRQTANKADSGNRLPLSGKDGQEGAAREEHPLADPKRKKRKDKRRLFTGKKWVPGMARLQGDLGPLQEASEDLEHSIEMDNYRDVTGSPGGSMTTDNAHFL